MATIESKNLLVWVKAMSRGQALPLDASEIYDSLASAQTYATSATAYAGQTIKALLEDGKYHQYILQPSTSGYTLEEVGAIKSSDLKQYVVVDKTLPTSGQEEGILYINTTDATGSIWTGSAWKEVFRDVHADVEDLKTRVSNLETDIESKAPLANPAFTGAVTVDGEAVAIKSYVDGLFAQLQESSTAPGIVDSENALPTEAYKGGQAFRVAEAGTYAGVECEVGDLILVVKDYVAESASDADFMVIQANIDGAVTSTADTTTVGEIVVFDAVTGKVIKGSGVSIASLSDAIAKAHEHENKTQLDTYDKTQTELLETAKTEAQGLVDVLSESVDEKLSNKADKSEIPDAYTKTEMDSKLQVITDNLNTKVDSTTVDSKIETAKEEILEQAATNASEALEERIGGIPVDTTIKSYIDTAIGSGGTSSAEAIASAKQEAIDTAKTYTDEQISNALTIVEF